jgi:hypothetical protein
MCPFHSYNYSLPFDFLLAWSYLLHVYYVPNYFTGEVLQNPCNQCHTFINLKFSLRAGMVAYACNFNYSGGRAQNDNDTRPGQAKS